MATFRARQTECSFSDIGNIGEIVDFDTARESYRFRSKVVHGEETDPMELDRVAEAIRLLAVDTLRTWLLGVARGRH